MITVSLIVGYIVITTIAALIGIAIALVFYRCRDGRWMWS